MEQAVFQSLKELIYRESGIAIGSEKLQLLANRIQKRMRALQLKEPRRYLELVEADLSGAELRELLNVVSTNVTYFWREERHFVVLREILEAIGAGPSREVKLWCAAASSGEEPYTMAMVAQESLSSKSHPAKILGTDISVSVLEQAIAGIYENQNVSKLPAVLQQRYLRRVGDRVEVTEQLRSMLTFRRMNLAQFPYPLRGPLDVIFCRNVMIYFDRPVRNRVVEQFWRILRPGGYLFLSHSENLLGVNHSFVSESSAVFRKPEDA